MKTLILFLIANTAHAADFSWVPGNYSPPSSKLATPYFTPELRLDTTYHYSFANPKDNTISGSSEVFRHQELQATQIGVGGDFMIDDVGFRIMTQFGMYSQTTPRNDPSAERGQWNLDDAYRYISEAYGTYHLDYDKGVNIQAGIFIMWDCGATTISTTGLTNRLTCHLTHHGFLKVFEFNIFPMKI